MTPVLFYTAAGCAEYVKYLFLDFILASWNLKSNLELLLLCHFNVSPHFLIKQDNQLNYKAKL